MTDFATMSLSEVAALNTPDALDYFWAHVDDGYFADREGFTEEVIVVIGEIVRNPIRSFYWPETICDYGCGTGQLLQELREGLPNARLYGVDYSREAMAQTRQKFLYDTSFYPQYNDILNVHLLLQFAFDLATCIETLEHIADYRAALHNIFQSLKVGGVALFTVPNGATDTTPGHVNHWTLDTFTDLMRQYGEADVSLFHEDSNLIAKVVKR